jgi:hypothetical protein
MRSLHSMRSHRRGAASLTLSKAARGYMMGLGFFTAFRPAGGRILRLLLARWRTEAAGARVDAQLGTNRACTSQGRVSSWGFRTTARVILSTHMPCAVECFGIMWLYMHPSRSPGRCGCKHLSDTDGAREGARTVLMEHVHTICRCSMRVRVRRTHARRAASCKQIARMVPQRHR